MEKLTMQEEEVMRLIWQIGIVSLKIYWLSMTIRGRLIQHFLLLL